MRMCTDSGVVMSTSGKAFFWRAFSFAEVSPVRRPTSQSNPSPSTIARAASPMSEDNARNGAIQSSLRRPLPRDAPDALAADKTWPMAA